MQENQAAAGILSELSKKNLSELDELLDSITIAVHDQLNGVKVTEHAGLAGAFGLPLPHRDQADDMVGDDGQSTYGAPGQTVVEESVVAAEGMSTLMFNSLCIRRPEARGNLAKQSSLGAEDEPGADGAAAPEPSGIPAPTDFEALSD
jgi:hypothetical protein